MKTVYLAGPILHQHLDEANNWRFLCQQALSDNGIAGISPLRDEPLLGSTYGAGMSDDPRHSPKGIWAKNKFDLRSCDLVLAYLPLPTNGRHQSFGTIGEIFGADLIGKPVILATTDPDVIEHGPLIDCAKWVVNTPLEAVDIAIGLLRQYRGES